MSTIQLLTKATLVVDRLAEVGPSTPAELAKDLGEPRSSVYRLTASLEEGGYLRSCGEGSLELGPALFGLGDAAVSALVDREGLRTQLRWIRSQLGIAAFFCVERGGAVICVDEVDGADVDLQYLAPGRALPERGGAAGEVLAAASAPAAGKWEFDDGGLGSGVATVAVPVVDSGGTVVGGLAVAGLSANVTAREEMARDVLVRAADAVARLSRGAGRGKVAPVDMSRGVGGRVAGRLKQRRGASVTEKAAALMEVLARELAATSAGLVKELGEPASSVYRMLSTLAEAGWVEQEEERGAYRVGLKMLGISEMLSRRTDIRRTAAPVMRHIHDVTGETTFLCIRHGGRAVCIERIDGIRVNSRVLKLGKSLPLHVGAAPQALLAFEGRAAWEQYASVMDGSGASWQRGTSRAEMFQRLQGACDAGFVLSDDNVTPGIAAVGVPIFNHRDEVVASLSVSGLREGIVGESAVRNDPDGRTGTVTELVCEGGRLISEALGAPARMSCGLGDIRREPV